MYNINPSFNAFTLLREFEEITRYGSYVERSEREINDSLRNFTRLVNLANRSDEELRDAFTVMFYHSGEGEEGLVLYPITLPPKHSLLYETLVIVYNKLTTFGMNTNLSYHPGVLGEVTKYFHYPRMPEITAVHAEFLSMMEREATMQRGPDMSEQPDKLESDIPKTEPPTTDVHGGKKIKRKSKQKSKRKSKRKSRR